MQFNTIFSLCAILKFAVHLKGAEMNANDFKQIFKQDPAEAMLPRIKRKLAPFVRYWLCKWRGTRRRFLQWLKS